MAIRSYIAELALLVALNACSKGSGQCASIASDPQWQRLTSEMNLPDYRMRRLNDYASTLESSGCQVAQMSEPSRSRAAATLDHEIARSLPLFVSGDHVEEVHEYFARTLRLR